MFSNACTHNDYCKSTAHSQGNQPLKSSKISLYLASLFFSNVIRCSLIHVSKIMDYIYEVHAALIVSVKIRILYGPGSVECDLS